MGEQQQLLSDRFEPLNLVELLSEDPLLVGTFLGLLQSLFKFALRDSSVGHGDGRLLRPRAAWLQNESHRNFFIAQWQKEPGEFDIVVVNLSPWDSQCYVTPRIKDLARGQWEMSDRLGTDQYLRSGREMKQPGLYLALKGRQAQIFRFRRV